LENVGGAGQGLGVEGVESRHLPADIFGETFAGLHRQHDAASFVLVLAAVVAQLVVLVL
jgi:hypothetical protein